MGAQEALPELFYPEGKNVVIAGGKALPIGPPRLSAQTLLTQLNDLLQAPYEGQDPKKHGLTKLQAGLVTAANRFAEGDEETIERLLNRICGKPVQQVASMTVTTSLKEYLDQIQAEEAVKYGPKRRSTADFEILGG